MKLSHSTIALMRVRGAREDTPALRLGLTGVVATGDLRPATMPPASVLIVRRLSDPLPGSLPVRRRTVRVDRRWEQSAQDALSQQYRRAYRPRRGAVPENAGAVVFEDEAELLACLAVDLARGLFSSRWWWKHVRVPSHVSAGDALEQMLIQSAERVPAAFSLLSESAELTGVVDALTPAGAARTLAAVAEMSSCESLCLWSREIAVNPGAFPEHDESAPTGTARMVADEPRMVRQDSIDDAAANAPLQAPWEAFTGPNVDLSVHPMQATLAAVSVMLHRHHDAAAAVSFARAVARWYSAAAKGSTDRRAVSTVATGSSRLPVATATALRPDTRRDSARLSSVCVAPQVSVRSRDEQPATEGIEVGAPAIDANPQRTTTQAAHRCMLRGTAVFTNLGGAFYLVNVMRHLGIPEYFEDGWRLMSGAGSWNTLAALARGLLLPDHHEHDSIWAVLAELAGRLPADGPIGVGCVACSSFDPPAFWGDARFQSEAIDVEPLTTKLSPAFATWLSEALPYVRHRLADAIGGAPADVARLVLAHEARVHLTSSHVDLLFPLDRISLAIRKAGLDRNPGWAPAYGRVITFHFE